MATHCAQCYGASGSVDPAAQSDGSLYASSMIALSKCGSRQPGLHARLSVPGLQWLLIPGSWRALPCITQRRTMMAKHESASVLAVKMLALLHAIARSPAMHAAPRITACCHGRAHRVVAGLTGPRLLSCLSYATVSKWKHRYRRTSSVADISAGASTLTACVNQVRVVLWSTES